MEKDTLALTPDHATSLVSLLKVHSSSLVEIGLSKGWQFESPVSDVHRMGEGGYHVVLRLGSWMVLDYSVPDDGSMFDLHAPDGFQPVCGHLQVLW